MMQTKLEQRQKSMNQSRPARFSDLVVSTLNQDNQLIWPEAMPKWLRPTVIRKVNPTTSNSPESPEQSLGCSEALAPTGSGMNPGNHETFRDIWRTPRRTDHAMHGGCDSLVTTTPAALQQDENPYFVGGPIKPHNVREVLNCYKVQLDSSESEFSSVESSVGTAETSLSPIGSRDWIVSLGDKQVIKIISKAVGPGGPYRKRMARLRYGFRTACPGLKLPYCLLKELLGSSLSRVRRAVTISSNTDELINALRE